MVAFIFKTVQNSTLCTQYIVIDNGQLVTN